MAPQIDADVAPPPSRPPCSTSCKVVPPLQVLCTAAHRARAPTRTTQSPDSRAEGTGSKSEMGSRCLTTSSIPWLPGAGRLQPREEPHEMIPLRSDPPT
eukprot:scaffold361_cov248-Pinguiococcus_pyrenoidosus.AAC.10